MKLIYVFDAYCGWCYGFGPTVDELVRRHPDLDIEVVSGGLFTGPRRVPIREFGYVQGANAKISELTGVRFGGGYDDLIADGSFVMDSEAAARGLAALRQFAPERSVELASALQHAFYLDGRSLSDPATYRIVAEAAGLDPDAVAAAFAAPEAAAAAQRDFARSAALGVESYPTLLAVDGNHHAVLAVGRADVEQIEQRLSVLAPAS
jgi:putative protein-disulfide isomerase